MGEVHKLFRQAILSLIGIIVKDCEKSFLIARSSKASWRKTSRETNFQMVFSEVSRDAINHEVKHIGQNRVVPASLLSR